MRAVEVLPAINAGLNATSAVLLGIGYGLVRRRKYAAHATCMIAAFVVSMLFLAGYLYHKHLLETTTGAYTTSSVGVKPEWVRQVYLWIILLPHSLLATLMLPMILTTLVLAARRKWDMHRRFARPTFWVWGYVSVTGVGVYFILYWLFPYLRAHG